MRISLLLLSLLFFACQDNSIQHPVKSTSDYRDTTSTASTSNQSDTTTWIRSFRAFRDAVYHGNKIKAKKFFDFPILNYGNEIWYLAYQQDEKQIDKLPEGSKPFREKDFDYYFDKLFSKPFITALLNIKSEDLYKRGNVETKEFREGNITYKMYATVDKAEKILTLNLASKRVEKDENGEVLDGGEFNAMYSFTIGNDKAIKFKEIRVAG